MTEQNPSEDSNNTMNVEFMGVTDDGTWASFKDAQGGEVRVPTTEGWKRINPAVHAILTKEIDE